MQSDSKTCRKAAGWAVDRAYGELSPARARKLDAHLAECAACAQLASRSAALAGVEPGPAMDQLLPRRARFAAHRYELRVFVRSLISWGGRAALAFMLALACSQGVRQGPTTLPSAVSGLVLFAWTVLLARLMDHLMDREVSASSAPLSGRAVAYGVLASVGLSVALLGTFFVCDGMRHLRYAGALRDMTTLLSSSALLLVGLAMGANLGRESSPNMLAVIVLYSVVMVPALMRGAPALLPSQDVFHAVCLATLWALSGAYLGTLVRRARAVPHQA